MSRFDDVLGILRSGSDYASDGVRRPVAGPEREALSLFQELSARWLFFLDPPRHTRMRARVQPLFTPAAIEGWRPLIEAVLARLLADLAGARTFDFIWDLAFPLPATVLAHLICPGPGDHSDFLRWCWWISRASANPFDQGVRQKGARAVVEITGYVQGLVREKARRPGSGLVDRLLAAGPLDAETLDDMAALVLLLVFAGNETTQHLLGNGLLALLRHPEELVRLKADPSLWPTAIEELARFDGPVQGVSRFPRRDVCMAGETIPGGSEVVLLLGSANRDELHFANPDRLDLSRRDQGHLGYGRGIHYCLGVSLARFEVRLGLAATLQRWPTLSLAAEPAWKVHNLVSRGTRELRLQT